MFQIKNKIFELMKVFRKDNSVEYWINEYRNYYLSEGYDRHSVAEKIAKICQVLELTGQKEIKKIRASEANYAKQLLMRVPANLHKKQCFSGLSLTEAIQLNESIRQPVLSEPTVRGKLQEASTFFRFLMRMEATDINPFYGLRIKKGNKGNAKDRFPLTSTELKCWFSLPWYHSVPPKYPYQYWVPLILRYTGARLNEICQLRKEDVFEKEGVWYVNITDESEEQVLKTLNSKRLVPIADELIRLGLIDFVEGSNGELFSELPVIKGRKSANASKWATYWRNKCNFDKGHDLHSLRHNFTNELKQLGVPEPMVSELVGHSTQGFTYTVYGHAYSLESSIELVNLIDTSYTKDVKPFNQQ